MKNLETWSDECEVFEKQTKKIWMKQRAKNKDLPVNMPERFLIKELITRVIKLEKALDDYKNWDTY